MSELREAAKEALRWMEHARLHLTIKERMHPDGLSLYDSATEALRAALAQPEAEAEPVAWQVKKRGKAMRDGWRPASEPPEDDRRVLVWMSGKLGGLVIGYCWHGDWSPYYLGARVTHWRDVTPPGQEGGR